MRLLILSSLFHPEPTANAVRMAELAMVLKEAGHEITVLTGFPYYRQNAPDPAFQGKYFVERDWNGIRVLHCFTYVARSRNILERLKTFNSFAVSSVVGAVKRLGFKPDGLIAISPPFFSCFSALAISRLLGTPYILDIQDLYPETAVHLGVVRNRLLIKALELAERFLYRHAAGMIGISSGFLKHYIRCGVPAGKMVTIPNWVDLSAFPYQECRHDAPTAQYPLRLGFFGNHGLAQGLETLMEGMALLRDEPRVRLTMIGDGVAKADLIRMARQRNLDNIVFEPPCPHDQVAEKLRSIDVGIVHLKRNPLYRITVPCKTYEYMALGKPILIGVDGEARQVVENHRSGLFFEPEQPRSFADMVRQLLPHSERLPIFSKSGRNAAEQFFSRQILGQQYRGFIEDCFF